MGAGSWRYGQDQCKLKGQVDEYLLGKSHNQHPAPVSVRLETSTSTISHKPPFFAATMSRPELRMLCGTRKEDRETTGIMLVPSMSR